MARPEIQLTKAYAAADIAELRFAFPNDDSGYAFALLAIARELLHASRQPDTWGTPLEYDLAGWRRSRFSSSRAADGDLRLIFRRVDRTIGIQVIAFGLRRDPDTSSIYYRAASRL